jgi:hypothetical protein
VNACIFCGQMFGPDRKRSAEHAAPKWCRKLLHDAGKAHHEYGIEDRKGYRQLYRGFRDPFTTVARDVCRPCNTGWMHEMEEWAERWLAAPMQGQSRGFRYWRQSCAAAWAVKTAMVWESVEPQHRVVPIDVARSFCALQSASIRQQVWLGRYAGASPHPFFRTGAHLAGTEPANRRENAHAYLIAFGIGQLACVVFGHLLLTDFPVEFSFPPPLGTRLLQVWPPIHEVIEWPPADPLEDAHMEAVVRALGAPAM